MEVAVAEYRRLEAAAADDFDFSEYRLRDASWGAVELHRPEAEAQELEPENEAVEGLIERHMQH